MVYYDRININSICVLMYLSFCHFIFCRYIFMHLFKCSGSKDLALIKK